MVLCLLTTSCHLTKMVNGPQNENTVTNNPSGVSNQASRQAVQYKLVDRQGKIRGKLVPHISFKWTDEKQKVEMIHYEGLIYDQKNILSRENINAKDGNYSMDDSHYIAPVANQQVSWRVNSNLTIEGTLIPEFNIVDPEPPQIGDEIIVYHGQSCRIGDFKRILPTTYKVTGQYFSAKVKTKYFQDSANSPRIVESLRVKAVPQVVNKTPNSYNSENSRSTYRSYDPVYRRNKNGEEMLYGFVVADRVWDDVTNQNGLLIESIHSIPVKEAIKGKHDPVCDIRATPAYEEFWKMAFYNFMEYLDQPKDGKTPKTCEYDLDVPYTAPLTPNRIVYTPKAQHLKAIENLVNKPTEANQYLCSTKWAKVGTDLANAKQKVICED